MTAVEQLRKEGYPLRIKGNDGYHATLVGIQWLGGGDYVGIYRYEAGWCCHALWEINKFFEIVEM